MLSVLPSPARARGGSLVSIRSFNRIDTSLTRLGGRTRKVPDHLVRLERICGPGRVLAVVADPRVGAEVVSLEVVPEPPKTTHSINDNYCVIDPVPVARSLNVVEVAKDKNISVNVQVNVSCPVVCPVPSAISVKRLSQGKT